MCRLPICTGCVESIVFLGAAICFPRSVFSCAIDGNPCSRTKEGLPPAQCARPVAFIASRQQGGRQGNRKRLNRVKRVLDTLCRMRKCIRLKFGKLTNNFAFTNIKCYKPALWNPWDSVACWRAPSVVAETYSARKECRCTMSGRKAGLVLAPRVHTCPPKFQNDI